MAGIAAAAEPNFASKSRLGLPPQTTPGVGVLEALRCEHQAWSAS
jgi:hypothetical protein